MGLLFVAISVNGTDTLKPGQSRHLAEQAFQNYVTVLTVSLLALFPEITRATFGRVTLFVTAVSVLWMLVRLYRIVTGPGARLAALRRHVSSLIGFGILLVAAAAMAAWGWDERDWFAAGTIVMLLGATNVSWDFLTGLAARRGG